MFKRIETAWNSRTPSYLHPHTKDNLVWQLKLTGVLLAGMVAKDYYDERQFQKRLRTDDPNKK